MTTYTTTNFAIEILNRETKEWVDVYGPDAKFDLDEARLRWRQLKTLCSPTKLRCKRFTSVHVITTTAEILDDSVLNE